MRPIRRVVLDTNILVSAALLPSCVPAQAVSQALLTCEICSSMDTLAELDRVLNRTRFDRYLDRELRSDFIALIVRTTRVFAVQNKAMAASEIPGLVACRDPEDSKFLALAIAAEADAIVSGDEDLLVLHPWQGVSIITAAQFLLS